MKIAQQQFSLIPRGEFVQLSTLSARQFVLAALQLILVMSVILSFFMFVLGGLKMILSLGRKEKVDEAKRQIINSIVGLVIVLSAWAIMGFLGTFFGIDFMNIQIPTI